MSQDQGQFVAFLRTYLLGSLEFRRENYPILLGFGILSQLEDLYESGQLTPSRIREAIHARVYGDSMEEPAGLTEAERRGAVELYLSRFSDSDDDQYGSYAWIWREASRILEEEDA